MLTLQNIILDLTRFWEKKGCIIHQGHDVEVGAGTFNPATFLRCLGPEPYKTAYVEPSRRPSDGRYGQNPNRMQLFHQYQVIIKPSPLDVKQMYLDSLKAIGFDLKKHDIRFVHDDWESPTLGAWGLGWEVWSDGMEITQFTYFQAIGSIPLFPVSAEITYGLERLAMFIQNVDNIYDVKWNDELTLGQIIHTNEVQWSTYNFEASCSKMWMRHFEDFENEAKKLIEKHLPIPAYDFVLKASHAFNMLDARGAISVTERTGYIARIRELARLVAGEYLATRESQGFPLLAKKQKGKKKKAPFTPPSHFNAQKKHTFLLEIGSEQLPASFITIGMQNLKAKIEELLACANLRFEEIKIYGSAQRLAAEVIGLCEGSEDQPMQKRGPPLSAAFDASGAPTQVGMGFFRSVGIDPTVSKELIEKNQVKGLEIKALKEIDYLFFSYTEKGRSTMDVLYRGLAKLILDIDFPKKMRWSDLDISYARPIQWIVALYGKTVIPFELASLTASRVSRGHEQLCPKPISIKEASAYLSEMKKHFVLADRQQRKLSIEKQLLAIEKKLGCRAIAKDKVLDQVTDLVEWPKLTYAEFNASFLKAPSEVLICEMVEHQKYFPLVDTQGKLKNIFVITADNALSHLIRRGNQKVLSARLYDGVFLYEADVSCGLDSFNEKLKMMTFQKDLGSVYDKVERLRKHAKVIAEALLIPNSDLLLRAALLCKADLASALVKEFPELQGTVGKYYALEQKEDIQVAQAIEEHWMPKSEGAALPSSPLGLALSLADKLDNLLGYFSVGLKPSSSSDPYALRRQTFGLINMLIKHKKKVDLSTLLTNLTRNFPALSKDPESAKLCVEMILTFIKSRIKSVFEEHHFGKDHVEACMEGGWHDPYDLYCRVQALTDFRAAHKASFHNLLEIYKRASGIVEKSCELPLDITLASEPSEQRLIEGLFSVEKLTDSFRLKGDFMGAFQTLSSLQPLLADFFDTVKVNVDQVHVKNNRLALLQRVLAYFKTLLDLSKL